MLFKFLHEKQYTTGFILFRPQLMTKKKKKKKGRKEEYKSGGKEETDQGKETHSCEAYLK